MNKQKETDTQELTLEQKRSYIQKTAKSTTTVLILAAVLIMFLRRRNDFSPVLNAILLIVAIADLLLIFPIQTVMQRRLQALEQESASANTPSED